MNFKQLCEKTGKFKVEVKTAENVVVLEWANVPHADGYRIFSSEHGRNYFVGVVNTTAPKVALKNLKNGKAMDYKVKAFRTADGPDNFFGESIIVTACPMQTPKKVKASLDKDGCPALSWIAASDCDGYKIYIDTKGDGHYTFLRYSGTPACVITDLKRKGKISFKVRAFRILNGSEKLSNFSEPADIELEAVPKPSKSERLQRPEKNAVKLAEYRFENQNNTLQNNNNTCLIILGGDISTGRAVQRDAVADRYNFDYLFSSVGGVLKSSDFSIAALDTDLNDSLDYTYENKNVLNAPSVFANSIAQSGLDAVALNLADIKKTPAALKLSGISAVTADGAENPAGKFGTVSINNISVAFINTVMGNDISAKIKMLKKSGAEYVIVYCSWKERHIPYVKDNYKKYARKLADSGADFIVGCGLNTLCEYDVLTASDGREVPVAYSLGCLTPNMPITRFENLGALLCLGLKRSAADGKITRTMTGYIPYAIRHNTSMKHAIVLSDSTKQYFGRRDYVKSCSEIAKILGDKIKPARNNAEKKAISFNLCGSGLIGKLFSECENITTDRSHLFISQLAISGEKVEVEERYYRDGVAPLYHNLSKGYRQYLTEHPSDYLITDLYYTACSALFEYDGKIYSGGKAFVESAFYKEHKKQMKAVKFKKPEQWQTLLDSYIDDVLSLYDNRHIILVKISPTDIYFANGRFIKARDTMLDIKLLKAMESYFIKRVNPAVIDLGSAYYGVTARRGGYYAINRERRFAENISLAAVHIAENKIPDYKVTHSRDNGLWLRMISESFDRIVADGVHSSFFDSKIPAEYIIGRTSSEIISSSYEDLKGLLDSGYTTLNDIVKGYDFGENRLLKSICTALAAIKRGELTEPAIDDVIRYNLYAVRDLSLALQSFFNQKGIIPDCKLNITNTEQTEFYLKCARLYKNGADKTAIEKLAQEYYNKTHLVIDVWGSENLVKAIRRGDSVICGANLSDCTPLTAFSAPVPADLSYGENSSELVKEFSRKYAYKTAEKSPWILVDFATLLKPHYKDGEIMFTASEESEQTKLFTEFCGKYKKLLPYFDRAGYSKAGVKRAVDAFADYITENYGANIILCSTRVKNLCLGSENTVASFMSAESAEQANEVLELCEKEFIKKTDCYVIRLWDKYIADKTEMQNAQNPLAFEDGYYKDTAVGIKAVMEGKSDKLYEKVEILGYLERAEVITKANPDMEYAVKKQVISDLAVVIK